MCSPYKPVLSGPNDPPVVAIVLNADGTLQDECWNWETGQSMALQGEIVVAVADDGAMTMEKAQRLYDYERGLHADCFGT